MTTSTPKKGRRNSKSDSQPGTPSVVITQELTAGKRALASRSPISRILADNGLSVDGQLQQKMAKSTPAAKKKRKSVDLATLGVTKKAEKSDVPQAELESKRTSKRDAAKKDVRDVEEKPTDVNTEKTTAKTPSKKKIVDGTGASEVGQTEVKTKKTPKKSAKKKRKSVESTTPVVAKEIGKSSKTSGKKEKDVRVENVENIEPMQIDETPKTKKVVSEKGAVTPEAMQAKQDSMKTPKKSAKKKKKMDETTITDAAQTEDESKKTSKKSSKKKKKLEEVTASDAAQTGYELKTTWKKSAKKKMSMEVTNTTDAAQTEDESKKTSKSTEKKKKSTSTTPQVHETETETVKTLKKGAKKNKKKSGETADAGKNFEAAQTEDVKTPGASTTRNIEMSETKSNTSEESKAVKADREKEGKKRSAPAESGKARKKNRTSKATDGAAQDGETKKVTFADKVVQQQPTAESGLAALRAARRKGRKRTSKTKTNAAATLGTSETAEDGSEPRVVYVGHVPHGFYEKEMRLYFSQFGDVGRVRLSRSKKSANSRGYAFVEFDKSVAAAKAAEAMDGYMMHSRRLKAALVPPSQVHANLFKGAERRFARENHSAKARRQRIAKSNDPKVLAKRQSAVQKRHMQRLQQLKEAGVQYKLPVLVE